MSLAFVIENAKKKSREGRCDTHTEIVSQCLKITEKVSFNIVYILSGQKLVKYVGLLIREAKTSTK